MGGRFFMNKAMGKHLGGNVDAGIEPPEPKEEKPNIFTCPECGAEFTVVPKATEQERPEPESSGGAGLAV